MSEKYFSQSLNKINSIVILKYYLYVSSSEFQNCSPGRWRCVKWYPLQVSLLDTNTDRHDDMDKHRTIHCINEIVSLNKGSLSGTSNPMSKYCMKATSKLFCTLSVDIMIGTDKHNIIETNCMIV